MVHQERWQLSGSGSEAYERYLVPALFTPWAVDLLSRVPLRPQDRVLDVACGTGIVARLAAQQVGAFGDAEALRGLLTRAEWRDVRIHIVIRTIRHPSVNAFIAGQLAATPVAASIAGLDDNAYTALVDDICTTLQPYTDDEGLAVPYETHVAVAHA